MKLLGVAILIGLVALAVWLFRNRLQGEKHEASSGLAGLDLLKRKRFGFGALCIFRGTQESSVPRSNSAARRMAAAMNVRQKPTIA